MKAFFRSVYKFFFQRRLQLKGSKIFIDCSTLADGLWHHVAVVRREGKIVQYLDGAELGNSNSLLPICTLGIVFWVKSKV